MGSRAVEVVKTGMESVVTAMETGLTTIGSSCTDMIAKALPVALPVVGAILVIGIGIKAFKKVAGR